MSIEFSENGKRIFVANHTTDRVVQISLDAPFDTSSHTVDGFVNLNTTGFGNMDQMRHATFSKNGLIMYISNDDSSPTHKIDQIYEFSIGVAGELPEGFADELESCLQRFSVASFGAGKKTPIQERPLDFPQLTNTEVTYWETSLNYPTTPVSYTHLRAHETPEHLVIPV